LASRHIGCRRSNQAPASIGKENHEKQTAAEDEEKCTGKAGAFHEGGNPAKRTIKQVVIDAIVSNAGITNDEMIAAVKAEFPKSAFKDTLAAWYRSQARKGTLTGKRIEIPKAGR